MPFLRQSTAQTVRFGPCLDIADGVTEETALTLAQADMRLSKDGGAFAQKSAAGNATHDSDGWYSTSLSTTDTATVGELLLNVHQPANMLPIWLRWWVLEEDVYDDLFGAAAPGYSTQAEVATEILDALTVDTIAEIAQGVPDATPTLVKAIMLGYMALRNKLDIDTSGGTDFKEINNSAGTVISKKVLTDDGSTYSEAKMITGP